MVLMVIKILSPTTFLILLTLMFPTAAAAAAPPLPQPPSPVVPVKRNCRPTCGISIPYPFGIGKDCYIHPDFDIECDESVNPPRAILRSVKVEVLDIPLHYSGIVVKGPVISSGCSGRKTGVPVDLRRSPFFFSYRSMFTFVGGRDEDAWIPEAGGTASTGCHTCGSNKSKNFDSSTGPNICSGNYCCQNPIYSFDELRVFDVRFERGGGGCKWAFLAENDWFSSNITDRQSLEDIGEYVPLVLFWLLDEEHNWKFNENTTICGDTNYLNSTATIRMECSCNNITYNGNPYLGCQDINECEEDPTRHSCHGLTTCVNVKGSYKCETDKFFIAMLVIGVVIGALLLFIGTLWLHKLIKKRKGIQLKRKFFERNGGLVLKEHFITASSEGSIQTTKVFNLLELEKATDCFNVNRILGQGGQGTVYKGMLENGRIIAIKKSKIVDENKLEEFINEVVILSQINHRNVVKLLGCCLEAEVPLLVYEFIPNGNLFQYLHDQNDEEFTFSWEMRLRIAVEVAGALAYLHSATCIPIYHRDIKSANILLDEKCSSKVSDFGTSRSIDIEQTHLTTRVQGTFGYLDPEYFQSGQFTEKSDVYSFGVVLAELVSGQKPIFRSIESQEAVSLASHFILAMEENKIMDVIDAKVIEHCHEEEVIAVVNLAKRCLNLKGRNRPTMKEVVTELEGIRFSHKKMNYIQQYGEDDELISNEQPTEVDVLSASNSFDNARFRALSLDIESLDVKPLISHATW